MRRTNTSDDTGATKGFAHRLLQSIIKAIIMAAATALVKMAIEQIRRRLQARSTEGAWQPLTIPPEISPSTTAEVAVGAADSTARANGEADATPAGSATEAPGADDPSSIWVEPAADGTCPLSHPVKVKVGSGIFHVAGGANYDRTHADRCYRSPEDAASDGFRAART